MEREKELLKRMFLVGSFYSVAWAIVIFAIVFSISYCPLLGKKSVEKLLLLLGLVFLVWFFNRLFFRAGCFRREGRADTAHNHGVWLFEKLSIAKKSALVVSPRLDANIFDRHFCYLLDRVLARKPKLKIEIVSGPVYQTINFKNYLINESTPLARKFGERFRFWFIDPKPFKEFYVVDDSYFLSTAGDGRIIVGDFAFFSSLLLEYQFRRRLRLQGSAIAIPRSDEMCWSELR